MAAPGVSLVRDTSPDRTKVLDTGENTGADVMACTKNTSPAVAEEALYRPDFDAMARMVNVPGVAKVTLPPDKAVDDSLGVDPSVV